MEIERLHKMLIDAGIEHEWVDRTTYLGGGEVEKRFPPTKKQPKWGYQIVVCDRNGDRLISAIEGRGTYGYGGFDHGLFDTDETDGDLIEIMGLLTPEEAEYDSVVGYLTADEVFRRIKEALNVV